VAAQAQIEDRVLEKLRELPPEKRAQVENFIDFLRAQEQEAALSSSTAVLSGPAFAAIWDNEEDAEYDQL
jgi:hypothetical protein